MPTAATSPATVSITPTNVGMLASAPAASRISQTTSLIAMPMTIARPGSVWSSAPRTPARRSTAPGGSSGKARLCIGLIVDFALLKHVS